jgi:hypothetical protein
MSEPSELILPKVDTRPDAETKRKVKARAPHVMKSRLKARQWAEAVTLWELGEVTLADLSKRYGLTVSAFGQYFQKHGIVKGSKAAEHSRRVQEAVADIATADASVMAARIRDTKEEHYRMAVALAKLAWGEILTAKQNGAPMVSVLGNLKALDAAMGVLKKAREERYAVLGLNSDNCVDQDGLPQLVVSELTPDQVTALRSQNHLGFTELMGDVDGIANSDVGDIAGGDVLRGNVVNNDDDNNNNDDNDDEDGEGGGEG